MKEKIIDYIENLESKANDSNKFFVERNNALIEIERLNKEREIDIKYNKYLQKELAKANSIIKEVKELRKQLSYQYYENGFEYDTPMLLKDLDKILDKVEEK